MAENEILDIGNTYHWRRTRSALCDHSRTVQEIANVAEQECILFCDFAFRYLMKKRRLYQLMKAANGSCFDKQSIVSNFEEKKLALSFLCAVKLEGQLDSHAIADNFSNGFTQVIVEQLVLYAGGKHACRTKHDQNTLDSLLHSKFSPIAKDWSFKLSSAICGRRVRQSKHRQILATPSSVAGTSLLGGRAPRAH